MANDERKLREACCICVADLGLESDDLIRRLYKTISEQYGTIPGKDWDYNLVDKVLDSILDMRH